MAAIAAGAGLAALLFVGGARARPRARTRTRAETDAAFRATLYRFVPKATADAMKAEWEAQRGTMTDAQSRDLLVSILVRLVPWETVVAFNRAIVPMLEAGTATMPDVTAALQDEVVKAVRAYGIDKPETPPAYQAAAQGARCLIAGLS